MFTGIVTDVGRVAATEGASDVQVTINTGYDMSRVDIGASIACAGVCLTVVDKDTGWFKADVSAETLKVTNLGDWREGSEINLERSLKLGDELGGHIVTGHVDCVGEIVRFEEQGESVVMDIAVPHAHGGHVAQKGSVTIDGASLTVNEVADQGDITRFSINLIPHTQAVTSFRNSKRGDRVNVEFDILARYVARLQDRG
ncbi:riboflavin synthase [Kordiimonas sp.]|uniref:riboflavin synthase n=1 Tax=Kordiimonas sp. TaxID=1970157 RepID=UPI003A92F7A0